VTRGRPAAKRVFDLAVAGAGLVILSPLLLLVAAAVKLGDGGPVFYRQARVGRGGRPFQMLKFRTMRVNADRDGLAITAAGDARITTVGRFLRKAKLDELPQFWNVLRNDMSIVGPRPEVPRYVDLYTPEQRRVLDLKPGITDEASVVFRDEEALLAKAGNTETYYIEYCLPRKIDLNLEYARRANVFRDALVIIRTVRSVWFRAG